MDIAKEVKNNPIKALSNPSSEKFEEARFLLENIPFTIQFYPYSLEERRVGDITHIYEIQIKIDSVPNTD